MLKIYCIDKNSLVKTGEGNGTLFFYSKIQDSNDFLLIQEKYGLDPHTLCSALDPDELPRVDLDDDHVAIICNRPFRGKTEDKSDGQSRSLASSLGMFLFDNKLVMICEEDVPLENLSSTHNTNVHDGIQDLRDIVLLMIYHTTFDFYEKFHKIRNQVSILEDKFLTSSNNKLLMDLFVLEKSMTVHLNSLGGNNLLLEHLKSQSKMIGFSSRQLGFMDDIIIDTKQCYEQAKIGSEIMEGLTEITSSLVSNKLSLIMKRLTVISLIFLPINAIAGIGGMSEFSTGAQSLGLSLGTAYGLLALGFGGIAYLTYFLIQKIGLE